MGSLVTLSLTPNLHLLRSLNPNVDLPSLPVVPSFHFACRSLFRHCEAFCDLRPLFVVEAHPLPPSLSVVDAAVGVLFLVIVYPRARE